MLWNDNVFKSLKRAAMLFFNLRVNRYGLRLSNELLFIIIAQGAAKLCTVKVGGRKKSRVSPDLHCKKGSIPPGQEFFSDLRL